MMQLLEAFKVCIMQKVLAFVVCILFILLKTLWCRFVDTQNSDVHRKKFNAFVSKELHLSAAPHKHPLGNKTTELRRPRSSHTQISPFIHGRRRRQIKPDQAASAAARCYECSAFCWSLQKSIPLLFLPNDGYWHWQGEERKNGSYCLHCLLLCK